MKNSNIHDISIVIGIERDLRYISAILTQKGREILNDYTVTIPQFTALQWLFEEGDMTIGELSNKMKLAFSTTTDLIDRMEKTNLVKRVKNDKDRRIVQIHLLQEGKRIIEEVIKKRQLYLQELLKTYSSDQLMQLSESLMKLHQDMK